MFVSINKSTGLFREQNISAETLVNSAIIDGLTENDIEIHEVSEAEYKTLLEAIPKPQPTTLQLLSATDKGMARVAEDLITVLIAKNAISETDLPNAVRQKLAERKQLRSQLSSQ